MKDKIHPTYFPQAKMVCACGQTYSVGSTQQEIHVEVCANCHPFYTGKQKLVDTAGRVDRFKKLQELKGATAAVRKGKNVKRAKLKAIRAAKTPKAERES